MTPSTEQETIDHIAAAIEASRNRETNFFRAWKEAVRLIGKNYFHGDPETAVTKEELRPNFEAFRRRLGTASGGERLFMLAVYQFYNDRDFDYKPMLTDLAYSLDDEYLDVLSKLLRSYPGW